MTLSSRPKRAFGEKPKYRIGQTARLWVPGSKLPPPLLIFREGGVWEVAKSYRYETQSGRVTVPKGFRSDLASVPRSLWPLIAPWELSVVAPLVHDYLYRTGGGLRRRYTRKAADDLFRRIMQQEQVAGWRIAAAYRGVRLFARRAWQGKGPGA